MKYMQVKIMQFNSGSRDINFYFWYQRETKLWIEFITFHLFLNLLIWQVLCQFQNNVERNTYRKMTSVIVC